jgi:hypothetical protein
MCISLDRVSIKYLLHRAALGNAAPQDAFRDRPRRDHKLRQDRTFLPHTMQAIDTLFVTLVRIARPRPIPAGLRLI